MNGSSTAVRWRLADLLDFEMLLARDEIRVTAADRARFARDIRPRLAHLSDAERRRVGLRLWLDDRRDSLDALPGALWNRGMGMLRTGLFLIMAISGGALASGLCLGAQQRVHVVVFAALTLVLPWLLFVGLLIGRRVVGRRAARLNWLLAGVFRLAGSVAPASTSRTGDWSRTLAGAVAGSRSAAAALGARVARVAQWGGLGFSLGVALAFVATLMVFDVRFYWEATPEDDGLMRAAVATLALPWAAVLPSAAPSPRQIAESRLRAGDAGDRVPGGAVAGAWWRFLALSVLVWGALPRLVLIGLFALAERRALAGLDFQAPRHRDLWRQLAGVERGAATPAMNDAALLLDVGGHGVSLEAVRGYMLRRLRVNPQARHQVSVLDDTAEAATDAALADHPQWPVILMVADWALSPRQTHALYQRVRGLGSSSRALIWVVMADNAGNPAAPDPAALARWTAFIDGLRDPAVEITGYDPDV